MTITAPNLPAPAGAVHVYLWTHDAPNAVPHRSFDLASWNVHGDEIAVDLGGIQRADGHVFLEVLTHLPAGRTLAGDEARALADALRAAADAGDKWAASNTAPRTA